MEVSGHLHAPVALPPGKETLVHKKVKSLCLTKHHVMQTYGGLEVQLNSFLTLDRSIDWVIGWLIFSLFNYALLTAEVNILSYEMGRISWMVGKDFKELGRGLFQNDAPAFVRRYIEISLHSGESVIRPRFELGTILIQT